MSISQFWAKALGVTDKWRAEAWNLNPWDGEEPTKAHRTANPRKKHLRKIKEASRKQNWRAR